MRAEKQIPPKYSLFGITSDHNQCFASHEKVPSPWPRGLAQCYDHKTVIIYRLTMRRTKLSLEQENPYHLCCNPRVGAWIHPKGGTAWPLSWWAEPRPSTSSPTQQFACNVCAEHQRASTCGTMQAIMFSLVGVRCLAQLPHNTLTISLGGRYHDGPYFPIS